MSSRFSHYDGSTPAPPDFISKVLSPTFWQKRKATLAPQSLDFSAARKGLGRWFRSSEPARKQRKISEPTYLEDTEIVPQYLQHPPTLPRTRSAMELRNPSTFRYPTHPLDSPTSPSTSSTTFPTVPRPTTSYLADVPPPSRQSFASTSSGRSFARPESVYYTPSNSSVSSSVSDSPSSAYFKRHATSSSTSSHSSFATSVGTSASSPLPNFQRSSSNPLIFANSYDTPAIPREVQGAFDSATSNLSRALDLPLVYLVALDLSIPGTLPTLTLLSSFGLPSSSPSLSSSLHYQALRAEEGGLMYKAPDGTSPMFTAGILIPVLEVRQVGYVLAAYTKDGGRLLESRDVKFVTLFAQHLERWVVRV